MNECTQASRVSAYHDGELSPAVRGELERHLQGCSACAAELGRLRRLSGLAGSMAPIPMPPAAMERLHRRVDGLPSRPILRLAEAVSGVAAAILIACVIGLAAGGVGPEPPAAVAAWDESQAIGAAPAEAAPGGSEEPLAMWMVQNLSEEDRP